MDARMEEIQENIAQVKAEIARSALKVGRKPEDVRLVVVSKAQPVEVTRAAIAAGATILGENYPEETLPKKEAVGKTCKVAWHMIGHVQSRKANLIPGNFDMLESLDSLHLAERLQRLMAEQPEEYRLPVLLEFNVGGEESKYGWNAAHESAWEGLVGDIEKVLALPRLDVRGLMTMPPWSDHPEDSRVYFQKLRRLRNFLREHFSQLSWAELSMGTSGDYPIAVEEGATLVRVGQAILGPRPKKFNK